jgi:hypothetical protein
MSDSTPNLVGIGGGDNWDSSFAGGGPADSVAQVVRSIENDDMLSTAANGVVAGMDLLGVLESPMRSLAGSAVGWLLEHIGYLNWFLDHTAGDPDAIGDAVKTLQKAAADLDGIAADHFNSVSEVPTYQEGGSGSFNAFFDNLKPRAEEIKARSLACRGQAGGLTVAGMVVSTTRGIIRDALTELVLFVIERASLAFAAAAYTGGSALIWAVQDVVRTAVLVTSRLSKELTKLTQRLMKVSRDMGALKQALEIFAKNALPSVTRAADQAAQSPELTKADAAKASHERPESKPPATPTFPWRVQGTLDDG